MARKVKIEARDVDTAINKGLREIGLRRDQVEVTVIANPSKGFLGIGSKPAVVEIRQKRWDNGNVDAQIYMDVPKKKGGKGRSDRSEKSDRSDKSEKNERSERPERGDRGPKRGGRKDRGGKRDGVRGGRGGRSAAPKQETMEELRAVNFKDAEEQQLPSLEIQNAVVSDAVKTHMQEAKDMLLKTLAHMGIKEKNVGTWWDAKQERVLITLDTDNPALLIGKDGKTLEAIQYLITLSLSRRFDTNVSVMVDTQNYWRKIETKLENEANKAVDAAKRGIRSYRLKPMSAQMRRYIHRFLADHDAVETESEGEGKWRKVVIKLKEAAAETAAEAKEGIEVTKEAVAEVAESVKDEAVLVAEAVKEDAVLTKDFIKEEGEAAVEKIKEAVEKLDEKYQHIAETIENIVENKEENKTEEDKKDDK
ncbi:KH domain-containing protein [Parelusimicrobium proximum]|uniref:RNA-binding cell elongation regulator Jag/EloR n=1 Tax=Parelusimicrobium proximum TaxID=3228953 RepID=UPI003D17FEF4